MDVTRVFCGQDGWAHLVAAVDCHDREVVGYELSLRGWAKEAERALDESCLGGGSEHCFRRARPRWCAAGVA